MSDRERTGYFAAIAVMLLVCAAMARGWSADLRLMADAAAEIHRLRSANVELGIKLASSPPFAAPIRPSDQYVCKDKNYREGARCRHWGRANKTEKRM